MKIFLITTLLALCSCATNIEAPSPLKRKGYVAIPLKPNSVGHYEVQAKINGRKANLILDTGASGTTIHSGYEKRFKLENVENAEITAGGLGTSNQQAKLVKVKKIQLGSWNKKNSMITLINFSHVMKIYKGSKLKPAIGVLGNDILRSAQAIIDLKSNTLYLKKPSY